MTYEEHIQKELMRWQKKLLRSPRFYEKGPKALQTKLNELYPKKFHEV